MRKEGPLILVEDDGDDQELMLITLKNLGLQNEVRVFDDGEQALKYLNQTSEKPFLILSDVNMPKMDGLELKKAINACAILNAKCIPFIFVSTSSKFTEQACELNVQGYFQKGNSFDQLKKTIGIILNYWYETRHITN